MPQIPDLWDHVLTAVLALVSGVVGAWTSARLSEWRAARDAESGAGWRNKVLDRIGELGAKLDAVTEAQHVAMRQQLCHNAEKYIERGWVTAEERQAWWDMYNAYDSLGQNGYIASYWLRIQGLPIREV